MSLKQNIKSSGHRLGMSSKLTLAFLSITTVLLISAVVSILEFRRMSTYVSDRISHDIECVNLSTDLAISMDEYNLRILSIVGKADSIRVSGLNPAAYLERTDSLVDRIVSLRLQHSEEMSKAYQSYKSESYKLDEIIVSDFIDSRDWYFTCLQPEYNNFRSELESVHSGIYADLQANSVSFDEGFYRGIIPGVVSVAVGIILVLLLLFFILVYYVRPMKKMVGALDLYRQYSTPYRQTFEGDDQLQELNSSISELTSENAILKKRLRERER